MSLERILFKIFKILTMGTQYTHSEFLNINIKFIPTCITTLLTLMTNEEFESGTSSSEVDLTSSIKKQNSDIFGMVF